MELLLLECGGQQARVTQRGFEEAELVHEDVLRLRGGAGGGAARTRARRRPRARLHEAVARRPPPLLDALLWNGTHTKRSIFK